MERAELTGAVSLIVPTRNEAENISELVVRLDRLPAGVLGEVIFVDDSDDDTPAAIAYLAGSVDFSVAVIHREPGLRTGGLSGAVVEGIRRARGSWLGVMDADLQHPPEVLADLFATGESAGADIVCATRNVHGGGRDGLGRVLEVGVHDPEPLAPAPPETLDHGAGQAARPHPRLAVDDRHVEVDASGEIGDGGRRVVVAVVDEDDLAQHAGRQPPEPDQQLAHVPGLIAGRDDQRHRARRLTHASGDRQARITG